MSSPQERLVAQLAAIRELSGLSLRSLARESGLSSSSLSRYLTGRLVPPWEAVVALCRVVGRDPRPLRAVWAEATKAGAAPAPRRNDLPADLFDFTGREAEAGQIEELLRTTGAACVDGMAGVGKTSLALHVAHRLAAAYPDGGRYLDLQGFTPGQEPLEPQAALARLLAGLDLTHLPPGAAERAALWRSELSRRRALVVLDNAADAEQVRPLLPGAGKSAVLITSRNRLVSLDGVPPVSLAPLTDDDAATLFARAAGLAPADSGRAAGSALGSTAPPAGLTPGDSGRAAGSALGSTAPPAGLTPGNSGRAATGPAPGGAARAAGEPGRGGGLAHGEEEAIGLVLRQCGGLPLALRMAGARLRHRPGWTVAVLAERLRDNAGRFDAVFGMSLQQLDAGSRRVFRLLGVLPGADFEAGVAAALADLPPAQVEAILDELIDAHLVQETVPGRYRMHDLIRRYAADLAAEEEPRADDAVRRAVGHYLAQAVTHDRILPSPQRPRPDPGDPALAMAWFDLEYVNLVAAFDAAIRLGADEVVAELPQAMRVWFFRHRGTDDQVHMLEAAVSAAERLDTGLGITAAPGEGGAAAAPDEGGAAGSGEGGAGWRSGEGGAGPSGEDSGRRVASLLVELGFAYAAAGRLTEALGAYERVEPGDGLAAAVALRIGFVRRDLGELVAARADFRRARAQFAELGNRAGESQALAFEGWVALRLGDRAEAVELARASIALADGPARITGLVTLGVALAVDDRAESLRVLGAALSLAEQHDLRHNQAWCHNGLGVALRMAGSPAEALRHHEKALELLKPLNEVQLEIDCRREYEETRRAAGLLDG
ncbi:tetratricopeptide repeat protein [Paractinoplanes durhamensis]|uniref:tetratricopeptide repeat protein n=1 Tax=Paractinoplanes durhamensis TaxID=113563 RepID=UPI0027DD05E8|nr:tetratricopeptide repeat protein [Actinoplanes durhamensis]